MQFKCELSCRCSPCLVCLGVLEFCGGLISLILKVIFHTVAAFTWEDGAKHHLGVNEQDLGIVNLAEAAR